MLFCLSEQLRGLILVQAVEQVAAMRFEQHAEIADDPLAQLSLDVLGFFGSESLLPTGGQIQLVAFAQQAVGEAFENAGETVQPLGRAEPFFLQGTGCSRAVRCCLEAGQHRIELGMQMVGKEITPPDPPRSRDDPASRRCVIPMRDVR